MTDYQFWQSVVNRLENRHSLLLAIVVHTEGHSPGRPGFKMAVTRGDSFGTVGGGALEEKVINQSRSAEQTPGFQARRISIDLSAAAPHGMVCGGKAEILLVSLTETPLSEWRVLLERYQRGERSLLQITAEDTISISPLAASVPDSIANRIEWRFVSPEQWQYRERVGFSDRIFIIGGGHVSLALSKILVALNFHITVCDERENLPSLMENCFAHEIVRIPFGRVHEILPQGERLWIAIMTPDHRYDYETLHRLIRMPLTYIGVMASPEKARQFCDQLQQEGIEAALMRKLHIPIGVPIHSETAEEIAVSIAAQLIQLRYEFSSSPD